MMDEYSDDLAAASAEWSAADPAYTRLLEAYRANQELLEALEERMAALGISQRALAQRMGTSQAAVNRIESGEIDPRISTIQRLAVALNAKVRWELVPVSVTHEAGAAAESA